MSKTSSIGHVQIVSPAERGYSFEYENWPRSLDPHLFKPTLRQQPGPLSTQPYDGSRFFSE